MRTLGYPPGWLEEARLQHSGISLFNSEGVAENDPDDKLEQTFQGDRDQYDIKKIYDFPGFNVPPPPGTRDVSNLIDKTFSQVEIVRLRTPHFVETCCK